jgi:hypothetical protein
MGAEHLSEKSVRFYQTLRRYIQGNSYIHDHYREDLKLQHKPQLHNISWHKCIKTCNRHIHREMACIDDSLLKVDRIVDNKEL